MSKPVRTTIVFALASGILMVPVVEVLSTCWSWPAAFKLALWIDLAVYAILLSRWSRTPTVVGCLSPADPSGHGLMAARLFGIFHPGSGDVFLDPKRHLL